jgi:hypothetical protein
VLLLTAAGRLILQQVLSCLLGAALLMLSSCCVFCTPGRILLLLALVLLLLLLLQCVLQRFCMTPPSLRWTRTFPGWMEQGEVQDQRVYVLSKLRLILITAAAAAAAAAEQYGAVLSGGVCWPSFELLCLCFTALIA